MFTKSEASGKHMSAPGPENELLICVARRTLAEAEEARLQRLLSGELDWGYLLATADRHCLIPLLYSHLNSVASPEVPLQVMSRLGQLNQENTRSSLLLTGELLQLMSVLEEHGIEAIPFKGPTLALLAYGDVGRRAFGDLDILVKRQAFPAVKELLLSQGFTPKPELTRAQQAAALRFDCSQNFANEKNIWVDVHWQFLAPYLSLHFDTDQLWDRLEPITVNRRELTTVSPEDLLLVLCLHGFAHFWERLGWICDVAALIESQEKIDWQVVLQNAASLGGRRILLLGLYLASDLSGAPVPPEILKTADATVLALADRVQWGHFTEATPAAGIFTEVRLHLAMRERKRDKLKSCLRLLTTPRVADWKLRPLPASLFFLYYALRPLRLAGKYGAKLLRPQRH